MKLTHNIEINENIIKATITVSELGNSTIDADTELNQLHNFVREIEYSKIDFKSSMKLDINGIPITTTEATDDSTIELIELKNLINKKFVVDENLSLDITIDVTKIPEAEYSANTVFNKPEIYGQALATLFIDKVETTIAEKLAEIRALANNIEKETEVIL